MSDWNDDELRLAAAAYLEMLKRERLGEPYSKAETRRALIANGLTHRSEQAIEFRMRNISAVLDALGRPVLSGYVPAKNVGSGVIERIRAILDEFQLPPPTASTQSTTFSVRSNAKLPVKQPPMIYFNIGWMREYAGPDPTDPTVGNHGYLDEHLHGAEAYNFAPEAGGLLHGYRPPGSRERVNIDRLGAKRNDAFIDGVTVVWIARERASGTSVIVGWYRNARVYREARLSERELNGEAHGWSAEARVEDAQLVPVVARGFRIQSSRTAPGTGFGQKPTWYGHPDVNRRVWAYIRAFGAAKSAKAGKSKRPPRNQDPELRRKVERAAVEHAKAYYRGLYGIDSVDSVEALARGWDLEVQVGAKPLLIEVKGLLRGELICELTPNEYRAMRAATTRKRYVVYVVNNALATLPDVPLPSVFEFVEPEVWQTADGRVLKITEKTGAVLSCD